MYKPPQNCNRVKSIKSKFENIENQKEQSCSPIRINGPNLSPTKKTNPLRQAGPSASSRLGNSENNHLLLSRQLSDPSKRNIKRTPAFRVDKNAGFERNVYNRSTLFEKKIKQFNSVKCENSPQNELSSNSVTTHNVYCDTKNCDLPEINNSFLHSYSPQKSPTESLFSNTLKTDYTKPSLKRPILLKSKSSHDFQNALSNFSKEKQSTNCDFNGNITPRPMRKVTLISKNGTQIEHQNALKSSTEQLKHIDLSLVYTEPIPKALRKKNIPTESPAESPSFKPKLESIYTKSTLQLTDEDKKDFLESLKQVLQQDIPGGLTDTLKEALKKPLPDGPAPRKPPRTFQHDSDEPEKKPPQDRTNGVRKNGKKGDPKYMLNKLEMALKNNKLRAKKPPARVEVSTTSGEDSDDSLLFRSKSHKQLSNIPKQNTNKVLKPQLSPPSADSFLGDFNCFSTFGCGNPAYERLREPNSSFFVSRELDPIYAEPINNRGNEGDEERKNNRNSLHYMSTALITEGTQEGELANGTNRPPNKPISAENSSLSSFTSDLDSNPSPVTDDPHAKIRFLIENFEPKRQTLPKVSNIRTSRSDRGEEANRMAFDSSRRVESLKHSLKITLEKSFNGEIAVSSSKDSDSEKNEEGKVARMVERFHTFQKSAPKYQQPKVNKDTLFYCCLVIEKVQDCAQIKFKFPPNVDVPKDIEHLCFPESPDSPPLEGSSAAQTYSLLVTSETGDRTYGYCRRVLPEGSSHCLPLAYCILSKYRASRFYKKILIELESRHGMQDKYREKLISQFYYKMFPKPGESITINLSCIEPASARGESLSCNGGGLDDSLDLTSFIHVNKTGEYGTLNSTKRTSIFVSENDIKDNCHTPSYVAYEGNQTELVLTLHADSRYEDCDLKRLHKLPLDILLKIFSSLLLERKVILIGSVISELSSCVDSLQSILYPFTWYHTMIPILPESLWDIVESPTPVVCGVLSEDAIHDKRIENGIVVNLDTQTVLQEEHDEINILSQRLRKKWNQFMTIANNTKPREYVYSVYLADAYLNVFVCCFKNYKDYISDGKFMKEDFIKNAKDKGIRRFLKMFTETCMFHAFVDAALNNPESLAAFDKKIELYGSDESRVILDKLMDWNR